jgi:hypothetical protein
VVVRCFRERGGVDPGRRGRDFGGDFVFETDELYCALANVGGECLWLNLTRMLFCGGATCSGIGYREVFVYVEASVDGILDGVEHPALGCANGSGAVAGNSASLTQTVSVGADDGQVGAGSLAQRITASAFPDDSVRLVAHL